MKAAYLTITGAEYAVIKSLVPSLTRLMTYATSKKMDILVEPLQHTCLQDSRQHVTNEKIHFNDDHRKK